MIVNKMKYRGYNFKWLPFLLCFSKLICLVSMSCLLKKYFHFVYPSGKPMSPHLLRCQGLAVDDYSVALGRLKAGATSTFAQSG